MTRGIWANTPEHDLLNQSHTVIQYVSSDKIPSDFASFPFCETAQRIVASLWQANAPSVRLKRRERQKGTPKRAKSTPKGRRPETGRTLVSSAVRQMEAVKTPRMWRGEGSAQNSNGCSLLRRFGASPRRRRPGPGARGAPEAALRGGAGAGRHALPGAKRQAPSAGHGGQRVRATIRTLDEG